MTVKRIKDLKFGTKRAYSKVTGYALYEEGKGYLAFSSARDKRFGILVPYMPIGGKKTLQSIIDDGGFVSMDGLEYVNPMTA